MDRVPQSPEAIIGGPGPAAPVAVVRGLFYF